MKYVFRSISVEADTLKQAFERLESRFSMTETRLDDIHNQIILDGDDLEDAISSAIEPLVQRKPETSLQRDLEKLVRYVEGLSSDVKVMADILAEYIQSRDYMKHSQAS